MSSIDYEQLEGVYKYLPESTPYEKLDRSTVLAAHSALCARERALDAAGQTRTRRVIVGGGKHYSDRELDELEVISLASGKYRIDEIATGRFLVCRIVALPVRTASIQFVVEDSQSHVVPVSLFRVPTKFTQGDLEDLFPVGACFAIKEPFLRSNRDGHYIRIESPSDFVRIYPNSPLLAPLASSFTSKHSLSGRSVEDCKTIGNKAFQAKRWHAAKEAYTWGLAILPSSDLDHPNRTLHATLLSNLAMTNLKLSLPTSARLNCRSALDLFPPSVHTAPTTPLVRKLLYRLSLSLYALEEFTECISTLSSLTSACPPAVPDAVVLDLLSRARSRFLEQSQAHFDFPSLYLRAKTSDTPLDVADYFAKDAFEVRVIEGKGQGLVARRRIKRGEVLIGCKPVACAGSLGSDGIGGSAREGEKRQYLSGVNLWTREEDPDTVNEVISQLAWNAAQGELLEEATAKELWAGEDIEKGENGRRTARDVSRLEGIMTFNGFHIENLASLTSTNPARTPTTDRTTESYSPPIALYPSLPSALNHSCIANTSYTFLSSFVILRARIDIEEGEELVISYVDQRASFEEREEKLAKHGFVCRCELCREERQAGREIRTKRDRLKGQAQSDEGLDEGRLQRLLKIKAELEETYKNDSGTFARFRPHLYSVTRAISHAYASIAQHRESIMVEKEGLASLGVVFEENEKGDVVTLVVPPFVGDHDAVLSALWIAKMYRALGQEANITAWHKFASNIERGQAGEELFDLRYSSEE